MKTKTNNSYSRSLTSFLFFIFLLNITNLGFGQQTRDEYIKTYKNLAIKEMQRTGIPASITMAQALLESDNGNSKLARRAKNHFGIKCHSSWRGKKFHQDDDKNHECFRKYKTVEESYRDHSEFLQRERYSSLFDLDISDYKGWARGLKKAGYATNNKYPQLLISIIEENNLKGLDQNPKNKGYNISDISNNKKEKKKKHDKEIKTKEHEVTKKVNSNPSREILINNRVKYIIVQEGDRLESINKELDLLSWQLTKYNEITQETIIQSGQILYLQPKRNKAEVGTNIHHVTQGETYYDISQEYAIKLNKLLEINLVIKGIEPKAGNIVYLRNKKK